MKPCYREVEFKVSDMDPKSGIIRGFASTFGNVDQGMDVVVRGAFKKTIQESKGKWPILADHNPSKHIGWNMKALETDEGLDVEGRVLTTPGSLALERYELAKMALDLGAKMGLSIGYGVVKWDVDRERPSVRMLKELRMYEYSIVAFPMNTSAMVTAAKHWAELQGRDEFIAEVQKEAKRLGMTPLALSEALLGKGAAEKIMEDDPAELGQSLDRLLKSMTKAA
jgi:uncharacterized protein